MNGKKKMLLLSGAFLLCVMAINQFIFPMPWACSCLNEDNARWVCRQECGSELNCEGWMNYSNGVCSFGWCFINGWVFCADSGPQFVTFVDMNCETCIPWPM
jgi:hypothetical protein